jgi:hypothetical protein
MTKSTSAADMVARAKEEDEFSYQGKIVGGVCLTVVASSFLFIGSVMNGLERDATEAVEKVLSLDEDTLDTKAQQSFTRVFSKLCPKSCATGDKKGASETETGTECVTTLAQLEDILNMASHHPVRIAYRLKPSTRTTTTRYQEGSGARRAQKMQTETRGKTGSTNCLSSTLMAMGLLIGMRWKLH